MERVGGPASDDGVEFDPSRTIFANEVKFKAGQSGRLIVKLRTATDTPYLGAFNQETQLKVRIDAGYFNWDNDYLPD